MTNGFYLSEVASINDAEKNRLNIIVSPCGSGKTTFIEQLPKPKEILFLIDTKIGVKAMLNRGKELKWCYDDIVCEFDEDLFNEELRLYNEFCENAVGVDADGEPIDIYGNTFGNTFNAPSPSNMYYIEYVNGRHEKRQYNIRVMTYAKYGKWIYQKAVTLKYLKDKEILTEEELKEEYKDKIDYIIFNDTHKVLTHFFDRSDDIIICDELDSEIQFSHIPTQGINYHDIALKTLRKMITDKGVLVLALTATPDDIFSYHLYTDIIKKIEYENIRKYDWLSVNNYRSLDMVINNLITNQTSEKILIYTEHISKMLQLKEKIEDISYGLALVATVFSETNEKYAMTADDIRARDSIINDNVIPDDINVLIFNRSMLTSININNAEANTIIVDSSNKNTQIQACGRIRHDIDHVYLLDEDAEEKIIIPDKYIGVLLDADLKQALCDDLQIKDGKRRKRKWNTIIKMVQKDDRYITTEKRKDNKRYWQIDLK